MMKKKPMVVIAGPTAAGKSEIGVEVARKIGGEIVSADSMQVYRYMDIGSAKITKEEMMGVPHHMIDVLDPSDAMDVSRYQEMAGKCIDGIYERNRIPVIVGGTGFYIQSLTRSIDFEDHLPDEAYREALWELSRQQGNEALHNKLREVDPTSAAAIHPNNVKRVIRALEYYKLTGTSIAEHNEKEKTRNSPYDLSYFVISDDRSALYDRINRRVDFMMEAGLLEEVRYLRAMGLKRSDVSMQGLGYKEMLDVLDGTYSLTKAEEIIKRDSRRYAKRQITWFKREKDATWIMRPEYEGDTKGMVEAVLCILEQKGIALI